MKRAIRRHHRARLLEARKSYHRGLPEYAPSHKIISAWVDTPKPCSSYCCGNPRKWFGSKTIQERRFKCLQEDA